MDSVEMYAQVGYTSGSTANLLKASDTVKLESDSSPDDDDSDDKEKDDSGATAVTIFAASFITASTFLY